MGNKKRFNNISNTRTMDNNISINTHMLLLIHIKGCRNNKIDSLMDCYDVNILCKDEIILDKDDVDNSLYLIDDVFDLMSIMNWSIVSFIFCFDMQEMVNIKLESNKNWSMLIIDRMLRNTIYNKDKIRRIRFYLKDMEDLILFNKSIRLI